jgi:DNA polymerase I-like protein with 3'-5' exonuclease and polymerase domains
LRKTIRTLNVRGVSVAYSTLSRNWTRDEYGQTVPTPSEGVEACLRHLKADIDTLKPKKIVVLGNVLKLLFPGEEIPGIGKSRGQHFQHPELGSLFAVHHPDIIAKRPGFYNQWKVDLQLALGADEQRIRAEKWSKPYTWRLLTEVSEVEEYVEYLLTSDKIKIIACDTETKNLGKRYGNILGTFQFCEDGKRGTVIPYHHPGFGWWPEDMVRIDAALRRLFTEPNPKFRYWVFHNVAFDFRMIMNFGLGICQFNRPLLDTGMMAYCQDENRGKSGIEGPYRLDSLLRDYLKVNKYEDAEIERLKKQGKMLEIDIERLAKYGASDAVYTWRLFWFILDRAEQEDYKQQLLKLVEFWFEPVNRMIGIMGSNGFWVDMEQLRELRNPETSPIVRRMVEITQEWKESTACQETNSRVLRKELGGKMKPLFGGDDDAWIFNIDTVAHKHCLFFDVMDLEPLDYGKSTRIPIVDVTPGQEVRAIPCGKLDKAFQDRYIDIPEVERLNEHSGLKKLKTSYVKSIYEFLDPQNGKEGSIDNRVRPSFWVTTTDTGRSSCTDPNLQQVPRADNWAKKEIKNMYAAEPGTALIQLDFMTSEVRWWGILSKCANLAKAFEGGKKAREGYALGSADYIKRKPKMRYEILAAGAAMLNPEDEAPDGRFNIKQKTGDNSLELLRGEHPSKAIKIAWRLINTDEEFRTLCQSKLFAGIAGDIHKSTASQMYKTPITQVTKSQRTDTKSIVFGTMFGRGVKAIAQQLRISDIPDVQNRINDFFAQFPDAEQWMYDIEKTGQDQGYVESPIGRRRRLLTFMMNYGDDGDIARAKRIARNAPIQGISSDGAFLGAAMFCDWLIESDKWHPQPTKDCWLLQDVVHDSLILQVPIEDVPEALRAVKPWFTEKLMDRMTEIWGVDFNIPLEIDFEMGLKWGDMEPWDGTQLHLDFLMNRLRKAETKRVQEAA